MTWPAGIQYPGAATANVLNMLYRYCTDLQNNKDNQGLFAATLSFMLTQSSGNMKIGCRPCRYICQERVGLVALYEKLCENVGLYRLNIARKSMAFIQQTL
eukprot:scpid27116/ scgid16969/ 